MTAQSREELLALASQCEERAVENIKWHFAGKPTQGADILGQADLMFRFAAALRSLASKENDDG